MTTPAPNMGSWVRPPGIPFPPPPGGPPRQQPPNFANHGMPSVPLSSSPGFAPPQMGTPYHQGGLWPQMGVVPMPMRPPYHLQHHHHQHQQHHHHNLMARPLEGPDSHLPGVAPSGSIASANHAESQPSGERTQTQIGTVASEQPDSWTAHRTETGIVYYYNTLTGESTYEKPHDFRGELEKVAVQPVPVSMVNLPGTDWVLVSTSDGKKYYYNNKTKVSSWQIPSEVTELREKQKSEISKEEPMSVPETNVDSEKGSTPVSLNAPAINTGGREAMPLRPSNAQGQGSSSALDLIKKKLQESGTPSAPNIPQIPNSNGSKATEVAATKSENEKDVNDDGNGTDSSSDSEDTDSGPRMEECIIQFKEMLKERGVAPFSKWDKELPKIVFDPRFKAIPSYSTRRSLFEHYVKTRVEEERKEKRAAQKAAIEGFKQLLDEASEDINPKADYQKFRKKWGEDPRFLAIDRKDRENLLNERVRPLKKAAEEKAQAIRDAVATSFKSMLRERGDITINSRWSRVKDGFRDDPRYKSVSHEDRDALFNEYLSDLRAAEDEVEKEAKAKRDELDKLKERERELRKRKEREEQEMERVRNKVRRKEAVSSFQALLVETIKDPQASWTESKAKLEKDPQGRASNKDLEYSEMEKLFREHIKMLHDRCAREFKALLVEVLTFGAASQETEDGKTALNSWSTAKKLLKPDLRYNKMPRKDRELLWRRYAEDMLRKQKSEADSAEEKSSNPRKRSAGNSSWSRGTH